MHYNFSSVSNASSKARKLAAMQSEIAAAAELKLLQAKLREAEAELASDSRGSLADSLNHELEQANRETNVQGHDSARISPSEDKVVSSFHGIINPENPTHSGYTSAASGSDITGQMTMPTTIFADTLELQHSGTLLSTSAVQPLPASTNTFLQMPTPPPPGLVHGLPTPVGSGPGLATPTPIGAPQQQQRQAPLCNDMTTFNQFNEWQNNLLGGSGPAPSSAPMFEPRPLAPAVANQHPQLSLHEGQGVQVGEVEIGRAHV